VRVTEFLHWLRFTQVKCSWWRCWGGERDVGIEMVVALEGDLMEKKVVVDGIGCAWADTVTNGAHE